MTVAPPPPSPPLPLRVRALGRLREVGLEPEVWMELQADYDLRMAQRVIGAEVDRRVQRHAA